MEMRSPKLQPALCTVMSLLLCAFSRVTVKHSDLRLCEGHKRACVTDLEDCGSLPPTAVQKTLNMSCYYQMDQKRTVTCEWSEESNSHTESDVSLIFSRAYEIMSCPGLFNPVARFTVTARIKNYMGSEIWSRPHAVDLSTAVKPSPPAVTLLGCTEDSVVVSWSCGNSCICRLRYRVNSTHTWNQAADSAPAHRGQTLTYTIRDLQPFTDYRAAVSCRERSSIWSDWSSDITARTLDRVPSRPPEVCYRVEQTDSGASVLLHLMWKDLDLREAGGRILGYQVSYEPVKKKQLRDRLIQNVTEVTALLVVEAGNCNVTVTAFNMAGYGPAARVSIDTGRQSTVPSIRHLWASSVTKGLLVQWETPTDAPSPVQPVSYFAVQCRSETRPSTSHWTTVDNFTTSTVIEDVDPEESYLISVFPVYSQQCGSPQSLPASLQEGALMEAVKLTVVAVTKTTVRVVWVWQRKSGPIRVDRYSAVLRRDSEEQTLSLWPDQWQHTFHNLKPSTEYSLLLLADNASINIVTATTYIDEVPVVATATPLLLLALTVFIISILSRTVYKSYFFPPISSPRGSTSGQWLMDPNLQKAAERQVLDMEDFQVKDVLGKKSIITVGPNCKPSSEEELHEDASLLSISHLIIKLDPEYVSDAPVFAEPVQVSRQSSYHPVYIANCHRADPDREAYTPDANSCFPQKEEESRRVRETSHEKETVVKSLLCEFMANRTRPCVYQMSCEAEYVVNSSSSQGKSDVETESGQTNCASLICENDYIANSCFPARAMDEA
uniref:interleukin-6 receptor subunit beta isoform X2 n=1 Tax=Semicossyphus pulcher TaxID=241346 RepID=UPI0037E8CEBF